MGLLKGLGRLISCSVSVGFLLGLISCRTLEPKIDHFVVTYPTLYCIPSDGANEYELPIEPDGRGYHCISPDDLEKLMNYHNDLKRRLENCK